MALLLFIRVLSLLLRLELLILGCLFSGFEKGLAVYYRYLLILLF